MADIYYCKNEDDVRRVAIHIFSETVKSECIETAIYETGLWRCNYNKDEECECCDGCEKESCLLYEHLEDKNVHKNIEIRNIECEFPCIICVANTYYSDERITFCSIADAKDNTKYGCG